MLGKSKTNDLTICQWKLPAISKN